METKQILENNCPNIVNLIGPKIKFWRKVESRYLQRLAFIKDSIDKKNYITIRKSFIDNLVLFKSDQVRSQAFLMDIDTKVKKIYENFVTNKTKVDKLRSILEQLVLCEIEDSKSYDRVAEIYATDHLLAHKHIEIVELEYKLANGKKIDCLLHNIENGEMILLDFVSINLDKKTIETSELLYRHLTTQIICKYKDKTKGLKTLDYRFRVFPILWLKDGVNNENIKLLFDAETNINTEFYMIKGIENVIENKYYFIFDSIDELKYWG